MVFGFRRCPRDMFCHMSFYSQFSQSGYLQHILIFRIRLWGRPGYDVFYSFLFIEFFGNFEKFLDRKVEGLEGRKSSHASNFRICCCVLSSTSYSQPQLISVAAFPTSKEDKYYSASSSANLLSTTPSASRRFPSSSLRCTRSTHLEFTRSRSSNNAHQHWVDVAKSSLALDAGDSPLCLKALLTSLIGWRWSWLGVVYRHLSLVPMRVMKWIANLLQD